MLIPRDYWEHQLVDLFHGLAASMRPQHGERFFALPAVGNCIAAQSGRSALVVTLHAFGLRAGARVGVPLFCCPVLFEAIRSAGCTPVFIDIEPKSFCLCTRDLTAKLPDIDAVVAVHMFGNACDITTAQIVAGHRPVIEDCCQALGTQLAGRPAGTMGQAAFFSFRAGKYISAGWGAALCSRDPIVFGGMSNIVASRPPPSKVTDCRHAVAQYLKALLRSKPLYGWIGYRLWSSAKRNQIDQDETNIHPEPIFRSDLAIVLRRLNRLEDAIQKQRANAAFLERYLNVDSDMLCPEAPNTLYNRYLYPLTFRSSEERDTVAALLLKRGIDTMCYLRDVVETAKRHYGYKGDCPVSENLSGRVLILPSYHGLDIRRMHHIARSLNEIWAQLRRRRDYQETGSNQRTEEATLK